jgi:N-acetylglucosamine-6-sulfatase
VSIVGATRALSKTSSSRRAKRLILAAALGMSAAFVTPVVVFGSGDERHTRTAASNTNGLPNVVVVMSDDQDVASMRFMSNVQNLLVRKGTTFLRNYASYSLCCPSRATFLTGEYAHNHGVTDNVPPNGGYYKLNHANTLPIWLQKAGYATAHVGKYLNGYGSRNRLEMPPGWSEWYATYNPQYFNFGMNENGQFARYTGPGNYQTDVLDRKAVDFIRRRAPSPTPFFLNFAPNAPHDSVKGATGPCSRAIAPFPPQPAPRHVGLFKDQPLPKPPSFNQPTFRPGKPLTAAEIARLTMDYHCRLQSLQAVDESVRDLLVTLRETGELDNTLVIYTSDNGFLLGQHRLRGKVTPYEESIRVPLVMRGPGVPHGKTVSDVVANIDLAPTIVDATNATPGLRMDGRSLLPFLDNRGEHLGRAIELEADSGRNHYRGVVTQRYMYTEYAAGQRELFDYAHDTFEVRNVQADPAYGRAKGALAGDVATLKGCGGGACRSHPHAKLRISYRHGRYKGKTCVRGRLRARISHASSVDGMKLILGGHHVARDSRPPFRRSVSRKRLRRGHRSTLRALLTTIDGREMTLDRTLRGCR